MPLRTSPIVPSPQMDLTDAIGLAAPSVSPIWAALTADPIPAVLLGEWVNVDMAGAVVCFHGTVRDHSVGRAEVTALTYEAHPGAERAIVLVAEETIRLWPTIQRVACWHRTGRLALGETAVVVAVSAPHRDAAFAAAAHCIDSLKSTVPLWKKETWADGEEWAADAQPIEQLRKTD